MKFSCHKLKRLLKASKRSRKDIAVQGSFSEASLSHWTLGRREPSANELAALARVFNVPIDCFFEGAQPDTETVESVQARLILLQGAMIDLQAAMLKLRQIQDLKGIQP
jgi:transcriptional regulator with XRE-family HTH domain